MATATIEIKSAQNIVETMFLRAKRSGARPQRLRRSSKLHAIMRAMVLPRQRLIIVSSSLSKSLEQLGIAEHREIRWTGPKILFEFVASAGAGAGIELALGATGREIWSTIE